MARKNNMWKIAAIALLLGLVLVGQAWGQAKYGPRTEPFINMILSGTFHMKVSVLNSGVAAEIEMFTKGDRIATETSTHGVTVRVIFRDNKTYMIMDSEKMILVTAAPQKVSDVIGISDTGDLRFTGSGTAAFAGKNLPYEEYISGDSKVLYFVDGNKLAGFRTSSPGVGTFDTVISELDQNVPDSVFVVPSSGYEVQDMSSFSF